jgi:hypothetical protein
MAATCSAELSTLAQYAARELDPGLPIFRLLDDEWRSYLLDPSSYYRWLAGCVATWRPRLVVELGNYTGAGTLALFSRLARDARLVSVDIRRDLRFLVPEVAQDRRLELVFGDDLDLDIYVGRPPSPIDLLFVDTIHRRWQAEHEWEIYRHLLAPRAVVAFDDIRMNDMPDFWEGLTGDKLDLSETLHDSGFGILFHEGPGPDVDAAQRASRQAVTDRRLRRGIDIWDRVLAAGAAWKSRGRSLVRRRSR